MFPFPLSMSTHPITMAIDAVLLLLAVAIIRGKRKQHKVTVPVIVIMSFFVVIALSLGWEPRYAPVLAWFFWMRGLAVVTLSLLCLLYLALKTRLKNWVQMALSILAGLTGATLFFEQLSDAFTYNSAFNGAQVTQTLQTVFDVIVDAGFWLLIVGLLVGGVVKLVRRIRRRRASS